VVDVSVVVATHDRRELLRETLESISAGGSNGVSHETIVVLDEGSTDGSDVVAQRWLDEHDEPGRVIRQSKTGRGAARNRGAAEASGRVLVYIDDDVIVPRGFLAAHLASQEAHPGSWVTGRVRQSDAAARTPLGRYQTEALEVWYRQMPSDRVSPTTGVATANLALSKREFELVGGFDESLTSGDDWDLAQRARKLGISMLYDPSIVVVHTGWSPSLPDLCRRYRAYSASDVLLSRKFGEAFPQSSLVRANGPIDWRADRLADIAKKAAKKAFSGSAGSALLLGAARIAERMAPEGGLVMRAYDAAVGAAIYAGVQDGLRRYGDPLR
jgi:glycosyltransferase involved in cell wall biosynthesis